MCKSKKVVFKKVGKEAFADFLLSLTYFESPSQDSLLLDEHTISHLTKKLFRPELVSCFKAKAVILMKMIKAANDSMWPLRAVRSFRRGG